MTTTPLPLTDPPRPTARQPEPEPTEDHKPHLSGGARYAICYRSLPAALPAAGRGFDRARSQRSSRVEARR
jgi:hypothetical protein